MRVVTRTAADFLSDQRFRHPGTTLWFNDTRHRVISDRVTSGLPRIKVDQMEIRGTMRGDREARPKFERSIIRGASGVFAVTPEAKRVTDFAEKGRLVSPMGLVAALAAEPVNSPVREITRPSGVVLVA